jgi:tetratricopeptide (TPR) repeat protein
MQTRNIFGTTRYALCVACALAIGAMTGTASAQSVSAELGKPVSAAQEAIKQQNWARALEQIKVAQGLAKTPKDNFALDQLLAYVYNMQKNYGEAVKVYERQLSSPLFPAARVEQQTKTIAQTYYAMGKYTEAVTWSKKVLDKNPGDQDLNVIVAQSYYQTKDYKNAADTALKLVDNAEKSGKAPQESWLRIAQNSYDKMENRPEMQNVLKKLIRIYQKPEDWELLLNGYGSRMRGDDIKLNYYRLMHDIGVLKKPEDYLEMAQLTMDVGAGEESEAVMESGIKNNRLKSTNKTEQGRYDRVISSAKAKTAETKAAMAKIESDAAAAANGEGYLSLGQIHLGNRNYDQAIDALQKAIKKGGLTDADEATVVLGVAYAKKGSKDQARQAFRSIKKESKWNDLAELWTLRV